MSATLDIVAPACRAAPVTEPLQTGIKAVDSMIPTGRGQRELIIGDVDRQDRDCDRHDHYQKGKAVKCFYRRDRLEGVDRRGPRGGAEGGGRDGVHDGGGRLRGRPLPHCYIAPYAGCAMAEYSCGKARRRCACMTT